MPTARPVRTIVEDRVDEVVYEIQIFDVDEGAWETVWREQAPRGDANACRAAFFAQQTEAERLRWTNED